MNPHPAIDWARSGLMGLTGSADGPPLVPAFDAPGAIRAQLAAFARAAGAGIERLGLDFHLLTERARLMQLVRGGQVSCNRSCRLLETRDGWLALNLPRPQDLEMLQPWLGIEPEPRDPWPAVAAALARRERTGLLAGASDLSIAVAAVPDGDAVSGQDECPAVSAGDPAALPVSPAGTASGAPIGGIEAGPLVVDLSSLWAGPLCASLLARTGARVIKVESRARPEPMRRRWPEVFDRLNAGKESVALEFDQAGDHAVLRALLARADIVVGSARPRAFAQLGLEPQGFLARNPRLVWIAITAHGWHGDAGQRVGFGDDAAAAAGLVARDGEGRPHFVGDAIADPLTGIAAATAALSAWSRGSGGLYDVSMRATAARIALAPRLDARERGTTLQLDGAWWLQVGARRQRVAPPGGRRCGARAAGFGADTRRIRAEFN